MANVQLNVGSGGALVATNQITRDSVSEQMELINLADPTTGTCATVDGNGLHATLTTAIPAGTNNIGHVTVDTLPALPAGANNIGTVNIGTMPAVSISGNPEVVEAPATYLRVTDATLHTQTAAIFVGVQNLSSSSQPGTITVFDGTGAGVPIFGPFLLGAGQVVTMPLGGIALVNGEFSVQMSGTPNGNGYQCLYR